MKILILAMDLLIDVNLICHCTEKNDGSTEVIEMTYGDWVLIYSGVVGEVDDSERDNHVHNAMESLLIQNNYIIFCCFRMDQSCNYLLV